MLVFELFCVGYGALFLRWICEVLRLHLVVTRSARHLSLVTLLFLTHSFYGKARFNDNGSGSDGGAVLNQFGSLT